MIERTPEEYPHYRLSRAVYVKDEGLLDRFDRVFSKVFKGIATSFGTQHADIPEELAPRGRREISRPRGDGGASSLGVLGRRSWRRCRKRLAEEPEGGAEGGNKRIERTRRRLALLHPSGW